MFNRPFGWHIIRDVLFWQLASFLAVLWALNVLAFLYSKFIHIPPYACPLALVIFLILYLINPFPVLHYSSRMWLLKILVSWSISQTATTNVITSCLHGLALSCYVFVDPNNQGSNFYVAIISSNIVVLVPHSDGSIPPCWIRWFLAGWSVEQSLHSSTWLWVHGLFLWFWGELAAKSWQYVIYSTYLIERWWISLELGEIIFSAYVQFNFCYYKFQFIE